MRIIGITGGVGSGKSRVLAYIEEHFSAGVYQADHVAWDLQRPGTACYNQIVDAFGQDILYPDGSIDRSKLGQIVFGDAEKLQQLNKIVHPAVKSAILEFIAAEAEKGTEIFVLEAALLLEAEYQNVCDELWYVYTDEKVRRQRLKKHRQYSDEKIDAIMRNQLSEVSFREQCQVVIDNSGDFSDTCNQIEHAMKV